jgi:hypothetical protein
MGEVRAQKNDEPVNGEPVVIEDPKNFEQVTLERRRAVKKDTVTAPAIGGTSRHRIDGLMQPEKLKPPTQYVYNFIIK